MTPPLGFVRVQDRTQAQHDAHAAAVGLMPRFALPPPALALGDKVCLFDAWKAPDVVADVGFAFDRIHQLTGSCVWAGGTNALFSTIAMQRAASSNPTKAFLPFTLHNYAMSRHYMGDDGQGEGSMGSTFAKSLATDGVRAWTPGQDGMPSYTDADGISVTSHDEMAWSSYRNPSVSAMLPTTRAHLLGSATPARTADDCAALIANGYGVSFACDRYIGHASIQGSSADACVVGYWDGNGGHQQSLHAVWRHPQFGRLFWAQNNWPGSTYARDPAGGPVCGCWVTEAHVDTAINMGGEVFGLSHLPWFPANPNVLSWRI